ncbi:MAG: sulfite reductase, ferredoxin dependent [Elainellaceae cyanobacterium]
MVTTPTPETKRTSRVEGIKERSNGLREPLAGELLQDTTHFTEDAIQILKFHGSYQQDNRDNRVKGQEKDYQFMLRTRNPGGYLPAALYLAIDKLSDEYGNGTLRVTTRQGIQIHGILKKDLKTAIAIIVNHMGSTLGACGDLNRNVMAPPVPFTNRPEYVYAREYADNVADLLTPQSGAYYDIWLDGEKAITAEEHPDVVAARQRNVNGSIFAGHSEPIYGTHYMPRKFKCCVTVPGDNSIDLYSQDVSLVVITNEQGELEGFNVLAGGGLGRTHNKEETFARLADPIGYVDKADVYDLLKAIVATQRDYGDRFNRRHARMKYLIHDWGVERFREQLKTYFHGELHPFKPLPKFEYRDYLGWGEQGDGKLYLGLSIENGRIQDTEGLQLKTALREIARQYEVPMRLTANHNILLYNINPEWKDDIAALVQQHGIRRETEIDPLVRYSMACPALPTCGLAVTESERFLPTILDRMRKLLNRLGLKDQHLVIRMTGCPNGCARPYLGEIGFVGQAPGAYQLWLGADADQNRLSEPFMNRMHETDLEKTFEPLFVLFKRKREQDEGFGDFCHRVGFDALREFSAIYKTGSGAVSSKASRTKHRIGVSDDLYEQLKVLSTEQGKPMTELASEAIAAYLRNQS